MDIAIRLFLIGIVVTLVVGSVFYLRSKVKRDKITAWIFMIIAAGIFLYILANLGSCAPQTVSAAEATEVVTDLGAPEPTPEKGIIKESRPLQGVIAAGDNFTIALTDEGKVIRIGGDETINVENWGNIIQVTAHDQHALGLNQNGTVVFAGQNFAGEKMLRAGQVLSK